MVDEINWNEIISHHKIPTKISGAFWMASNRIHIYELVKDFIVFHKYIEEHEKKHYLNYNCDKPEVIRIILDIWNEWKGAWKITTNKELRKEKEKYMNKLRKINVNGNIIKNLSLLMEELNEINAAYRQRRYSNIVWFFRPYQWGGNLLVALFGLGLYRIIVGILKWYFL